MILTVTVNANCAPQTVDTPDGPAKLAPGESLTAEFTDAQVAYMLACPGHFTVSDVKAAPEQPIARETASKPKQFHRGRGRR